jgi:hypothetical protein
LRSFFQNQKLTSVSVRKGGLDLLVGPLALPPPPPPKHLPSAKAYLGHPEHGPALAKTIKERWGATGAKNKRGLLAFQVKVAGEELDKAPEDIKSAVAAERERDF